MIYREDALTKSIVAAVEAHEDATLHQIMRALDTLREDISSIILNDELWKRGVNVEPSTREREILSSKLLGIIRDAIPSLERHADTTRGGIDKANVRAILIRAREAVREQSER